MSHFLFHFCGATVVWLNTDNFPKRPQNKTQLQQLALITLPLGTPCWSQLLIPVLFLCRNCIACIKPDKLCFLNSSKITHVNRDVYNVSYLLAALVILPICIHKSYFGFTFKTEHFHGCVILQNIKTRMKIETIFKSIVSHAIGLNWHHLSRCVLLWCVLLLIEPLRNDVNFNNFFLNFETIFFK